jgi:hypothetical protein
MLARQGAEIHTYTYSELKGSNFFLVRNAGKPRNSDNTGGGGYGLILFPYWNEAYGYRHTSDPSWAAKWYRGDSLGAHAIHYGNGTGHHSLQDNGFGPSDNVGVGCRASFDFVTVTVGASNLPDSALVLPASNDTLFYTRMPRVLASTNGSGGISLPSGASALVRLFRSPGRALGDSIVTLDSERMFGGYRVYYTNQGNSPTVKPYVDFVLGSDGASGGTTMTASILWAEIAKWIDVKPIACAMAWNDMNEDYSDPAAWPRASYQDSIVKDLGRYGVTKIDIGTQADTSSKRWTVLPAYQIQKTWPNARWAIHYHTIDSLSETRHAFGGGLDNFRNVSAARRVVANRWDPTNATGALRFGVAQTLSANDSIFRANGLRTSPMILPGNDQLMPVGWNDYATGTVCPSESLFSALAGTGHTVLSNFPAGTADVLAPIGVVRTGVPIATAPKWQIYPFETYTTTSGNRIKFWGYTVVSSSNGNPASMTNVYPGCTAFVNELMGFHAYRMGASFPATRYGQSSVSIPQNVDQGRFAIAGWHTNFVGNNGIGWFADYYYQKVCYLTTLQTLSAMAARPLVEWVYGEEIPEP